MLTIVRKMSGKISRDSSKGCSSCWVHMWVAISCCRDLYVGCQLKRDQLCKCWVVIPRLKTLISCKFAGVHVTDCYTHTLINEIDKNQIRRHFAQERAKFNLNLSLSNDVLYKTWRVNREVISNIFNCIHPRVFITRTWIFWNYIPLFPH
jgi:hypothetical protein